MDPTGCGDAFRAGLMTAMQKGMDWPTCGRLAGLMGAIKIGHRGGQNHRFGWDEIAERFKAEYGYEI
jgi:adenosine kinase